MLKKIAFLLVACAIMVTGCKDEEAGPVIDFGTLERGAFPRLQQLDFGEFDLANLSTSVYQHTVDFVDGNGGDNVATYRILVAFDDNNPDNGDLSTDFAVFDEISASEFSDLDTGNKGFTLTIPFTEVASFVGAGNTGDVLSGDRFQFRTELVRNDGTVFNSVNSTPAVTNAFGGIWNWNVNATCPLADDFFAGTYSVEYGFVYDEISLFGAPVQAIGPLDGFTVDISPVAGSTTRRSFALGDVVWLPGYGFGPAAMEFDFACDIVTSTSIVGGASCDGSGTLGATPTGPVSFSLSDDSSITFEYEDFTIGGCRGETANYSLVFTKQ